MIAPAILACAPAGGGPTPYHADAVRLPSASVIMGFPTTADTRQITIVGWAKIPADELANFPAILLGSVNPVSMGVGFINNTDINVRVRPYPTAQGFGFNTDDGVVIPDVWNLFCLSANTNFSAGNKIGQIYYNGVSVLNPALNTDATAAFDIGIQGIAMGSPDNLSSSDAQYVEYADLQVWFGQAIDFSVPGNLANFLNGGKPVDPAVAAVTFGAHSILLSGNSTGYPINQGNAGPVSLVTGTTNVTGSNGPGLCTCSRATVGASVVAVQSSVDARHLASSQFEATISVDGHILQTSATDNSAVNFAVYLANADALTNASTSPSD